MKSRLLLLLLAFFLSLNVPSALAQDTYFPADEWRTSTPEQQGMDSYLLANAIKYLIMQREEHIHSLTIIRNGYVVTDARFYPYITGEPHDVASVTKSVTATLVGIAIQQGYFQGVQQHIGDIIAVPADKAEITLEDLLTMRSGIDCDNEALAQFKMYQSPDWVQAVLEMPLKDSPGRRWVYCSPAVHLLGGLIQQATGQNLFDYAQQNLFNPLGIHDAGWPADPQGIAHGWGDLRLMPADMAKIGYLYLNNGVWNGQQLLPENWVQDATTNINRSEQSPYGYLWWLYDGYYAAQGRGGQYIFVFPNQSLVVVMTGNGGMRRDDFIHDYLLSAIKSDAPLPANLTAELSLQDAIHAATIAPPVEAQPVKPLPALAQAISGKTIQFDRNPAGLLTASLSFEAPAEAALHLTATDFLAGDVEFSWIAGLDGVPRTTSGRYGLSASATGVWGSDTAFVMRVDEIANNNIWTIRFSFNRERVTMTMDSTAGTISASGILQE